MKVAILLSVTQMQCQTVAQTVKHCASNTKVVGSIPRESKNLQNQDCGIDSQETKEQQNISITKDVGLIPRKKARTNNKKCVFVKFH